MDFFDRLDQWVAAITAVEFTDDEDGSQTDRAVALVNTFVYIHMLGSYGVADSAWIRETWERHEGTQCNRDERAVLDAFFADVDAWFDSHPDTGAISRIDWSDIELPESSVESFYRTLKRVLGVETREREPNPGITDYDYTQIDEDIFGRIYEQYLADGREGRGIYYTPDYVSKSVVDDTVGVQLRHLSTRIANAIEEESWDDAETAMARFTEFTVLDPACGTGSFLVAAYTTISDEYDHLFELLATERQSRRQSPSESARVDSGDCDAIERLETLQQMLGGTEDTTGSHRLRTGALVARIVLRHIHGIDLDHHALAVAKHNIWLEAIERDPHIVSGDTSVDERWVFPALDANLGVGDALVGLPDEQVHTRLHERYDDEMEAVHRARVEYLDAPDDPTPLTRATALTAQIRADLDATFEAFLDSNQLPSAVIDETTPFYWPLQFWHVFEDGEGFDCVVGNPPWVIEGKEHTKRFLQQTYDQHSGQPDLYRYFLERSFSTTTGRLGMVTPNTWLSIPGARQLRRVVLCNARLEKIAFVPDSAFTGVGQNSIVVVVDRNAPPTASTSNTVENPPIRVGDIEKNGTFRERRTIRPADIEPTSYHVNPYVGTAENVISRKMTTETVELAEIADLTVGYQLYHRSLHTDAQIDDEQFHSETNVGGEYVADTRGDALSRYHLDRSKDRFVDRSAEFFRIPPPRFLDGEKLLLREMPSKRETGLIATRSQETLLFPKSVISVVLTDDAYDYEHLLGLLNSRLLYLVSVVTGEKMGQHLFPRVSLTQLRRLPIEGTTELTPLVRTLENLAASRRRFRRIWDQHTEMEATETRTLAQILSEDGEASRRESRDETWTVACSVDPESDADVLEREFSAFEFVGSPTNPELVLYGIDGGVEHELIRVTFRNRKLQQMVYLAMTTLFESRARVNHLRHVLEKTAVPVGEGASVERAGHRIRTVEHALEADAEYDATPGGETVTRDGETVTEGVVTESRAVETTDIVKIDDAMATAQIELDAAVFDCYGLTEDEATTVLSALNIRETVLGETVAKLAARQTGDDET